jgi:hypothetical protein
MHCGKSYLPRDENLPPQAKDLINDIVQAFDDDAVMRRQDPRCFPMMKRHCQQLERKLQSRIIRQQGYLEVMRHDAHGLFGCYQRSIVTNEDVASLHKYNLIVNPPAVHTLASSKCITSCIAANTLLLGWNALAGG